MPPVRAFVDKSARLIPLDGGTPILPTQPPPVDPPPPPPPPPPPGGKGLLIGASTSRGQAAYDTIQAQAGPWTVARSYNPGGLKATWAADVSGPDVGKRASVFSAKPNLADMASGALDAATLAWINSIPNSHVAFVTIWHEPDVKIRKGTLTAAAFIPGIRRFCQLVKQVGKPHVYTHLCVSNWTFIGGTSVTMDTVWPGDGLVDVISVDQYMDSNTQHPGSYYFDPVVAYAKSKGCDWGIAEIGMGSAVNDFTAGATWMGTQVGYAASHGGAQHTGSAAFLTWFDINTGGVTPTPSGDSHLITASASLSAANHTPYTSFVL